MSYFKVVLPAILLALSVNVKASVVSMDLNAAGDGLITYDNNSRLNWLDLTETTNISYLEMTGLLQTGGLYEGWRYATTSEVVGLWDNFGFDLSNTTSAIISGFDVKLNDASALLGLTYSFPYPRVLGITQSQDGSIAQMGVQHEASFGRERTRVYGELFNGFDQNFKSLAVGNYLVQDVSTVPVPAAAWLFGSALLGFFGFSRRKAKA